MTTITRTALIALTGLTFSLAGCAAPLIFTKPGGITNIGEFRTDNYQCVQETRTTPALVHHGRHQRTEDALLMLAVALDAAAQERRLYKMCMEARGYDARPLQEGEVVQH